MGQLELNIASHKLRLKVTQLKFTSDLSEVNKLTSSANMMLHMLSLHEMIHYRPYAGLLSSLNTCSEKSSRVSKLFLLFHCRKVIRWLEWWTQGPGPSWCASLRSSSSRCHMAWASRMALASSWTTWLPTSYSLISVTSRRTSRC